MKDKNWYQTSGEFTDVDFPDLNQNLYGSNIK